MPPEFEEVKRAVNGSKDRDPTAAIAKGPIRPGERTNEPIKSGALARRRVAFELKKEGASSPNLTMGSNSPISAVNLGCETFVAKRSHGNVDDISPANRPSIIAGVTRRSKVTKGKKTVTVGGAVEGPANSEHDKKKAESCPGTITEEMDTDKTTDVASETKDEETLESVVETKSSVSLPIVDEERPAKLRKSTRAPKRHPEENNHVGTVAVRRMCP